MTFLTKKINLIIFTVFLFNISLSSYSLENKIIFKINNEIITTFDITREFKYLTLINPKVINLDKKEIFEISKNSIIREKIKKIEILKHIKEIKLDEKFMKNLLDQNFDKLGVRNKNELKSKINEIGFNINEFEEKLSIEAIWNQLVYEKYISKVKIDKTKLEEEIILNKKQLVFNLSEIVFTVENKKIYTDKLEIIYEEIKKKGFENAALLYSVSETKSLGGDLGWIEENSIDKKLSTELKNLKIGEFTQPIVIPGGFLILKLKDKKEKTISMNVDDELNKLIRLKTNQQLNRFSNIYFNKIKKNIKIEKI